MTINHLLQIGENFYYNHTYLALAIIAAILIIAILNPKAILKTAVVLLILALSVYVFSLLGRTSSQVMENKKQLIDRSRD